MLENSDLRRLDDWCRSRDLRWSPSPDGDGRSGMVLEARDAGGPWQRMLLLLERTELRLLNEMGETLASASGLPALLDAVDGGVAEPIRPSA